MRMNKQAARDIGCEIKDTERALLRAEIIRMVEALPKEEQKNAEQLIDHLLNEKKNINPGYPEPTRQAAF